MITDRQYIGEFHEYPRDTKLEVCVRQDLSKISLIFTVRGSSEPHLFTLEDSEAMALGKALWQLALLSPSCPVPEGMVRQ